MYANVMLFMPIINVCPAKYGLCNASVQKTHNYCIHFCEHLLHWILSEMAKSVENMGKFSFMPWSMAFTVLIFAKLVAA